MAKKDNLKFLVELNFAAVKKLIDDVTEEESIMRFDNITNHIRWQTGHILNSADSMLKILGEDGSVPEKWSRLFKRGGELSEDNSVYPAMSELREKLYSLYVRLPEELEDKTEAFFDEEIEISPGWKETRMNGFIFFGEHTFYHCGQIAMMVRSIGRERPFG